MTTEEKAKKFDELILILKNILPGNGAVVFDGKSPR